MTLSRCQATLVSSEIVQAWSQECRAARVHCEALRTKHILFVWSHGLPQLQWGKSRAVPSHFYNKLLAASAPKLPKFSTFCLLTEILFAPLDFWRHLAPTARHHYWDMEELVTKLNQCNTSNKIPLQSPHTHFGSLADVFLLILYLFYYFYECACLARVYFCALFAHLVSAEVKGR